MKITKHIFLIMAACLLMYSCNTDAGDPKGGNSNGGSSGSGGSGSGSSTGDTTGDSVQYDISFDYGTAKMKYGDFSIVGESEGATFEQTDHLITITATEEGMQYTLSGCFSGQIINNTKNTVLNLKGAYLENHDAMPVIVSTKKLEISAKEGTPSYIVSRAKTPKIKKSGTIYCYDETEDKYKDLEIGGKGTCYVVGIVHGIKADDVKAKGSGTWYIAGTPDNSAINCNTFITKEGATVTLVLGNAKNGIKADNSIEITSGTFWFENVKIALKTDTVEDEPDVEHFIKVSDCKIYKKAVERLSATDSAAYTQADTAVVTDVE